MASLAELGDLGVVEGDPSTVVALARLDSRAVQPGDLFCAVPGFSVDGHDFAAGAVERGAAALLVERTLPLDVPQLVVADARVATAQAAARLAGDPTARLRVVGITGTNGKTTSTYLVRHLLQTAGAGTQTGLIGTVEQIVGGQRQDGGRTTPESPDLQALFAAMLEAGDEACVIEVSSHAIRLHRADAIHWAAVAFTNLSRDHLDFHPTMDDYFAAKRELIAAAPGVAVVDLDDAYGARLAAEFPQALTVSIDAPGARLRATELEADAAGTSFTVDGHRTRVPLPGRFNVRNALTALGLAVQLGIDLAAAAAALPLAPVAPGRMETIDEGQPFAVFVDYAHTPDALERVLASARGLTSGRVLCVFGCGGDRDRGKRPEMGHAVDAGADVVIVTSDNPRSEDPQAIIDDVLAGITGPSVAIVDRRAAIAHALAEAAPGDVVVIAGKGHEQGQTIAGTTHPFDDAQVARELLAAVTS